ALARADVLEPGSVLTFVHPVVRTAVYQDLSAEQRAIAHGRAARRLAERGAPADRVAAHVLLAPTGASWAVPVLRDAAGRAAALGAPAAAASYLERALDEIGPGPERVGILIELGRAGLAADHPSALGHLRQAVTSAENPSQRTTAAVALARALRYGGEGSQAIDVLECAARKVDSAASELTESLDVELLACTAMSASARLRLADWLARRLAEPRHPARTAWEHLSLAALALDAGLSGQPGGRAQDLATRAVAGAELITDSGVRNQVTAMAGLAYLLVDRFDRAASLFEALARTSAQLVLAGTHTGTLARRASLHLRCGRLSEAQADATRALELGSEVQGARSLLPRAASVLVSVAAEQGTSPPSWVLAAEIDADSLHTRLLMHSRGELLLAQGQLRAAVAGLLAYGERNRLLGWGGPATPWRSQAALALQRLGERDRAHELVSDELALARRQGAARATGVALRAAGLLAEGSQRERLLGQAVDVLAGSGAVLERARALVSLGIELRHRGTGRSSRDVLRQGHDLALGCQATRLAQLAQTELRLAGGRPRRAALTGPQSLTAGERRVADLVVDGMSNRQVAQSLFLTEKTVETHLGHVYAKLGISSRRSLAAAVASTASGAIEADELA
ncbi:MAG: LuxR C-terminal-related transcriptional regulator, partial [Solirubrobacteraceae bacterium]